MDKPGGLVHLPAGRQLRGEPKRVGWIVGKLHGVEVGKQLTLVAGAQCIRLNHRGELDRWSPLRNRWLPGHVESSALLGWVWTDGRLYFRLWNGDEVRVREPKAASIRQGCSGSQETGIGRADRDATRGVFGCQGSRGKAKTGP